ncbi:3-oxo-tetronate kinase [uncultured Shimia sp.]|uniref:3-oxo-tetronate kinase n=1 Tax=uncultured Shimia sp. TaxID=573152 RepID=UPI00263A087B|nr:3-oxo-tetronate kinase [uncultured Shimia sp.]
MKLGVIADDFTGASDIALTIAEAGMSVTQYIGIPVGDATSGSDAGVVALKSRTAAVSEAVADSLAACNWLKAQGAEQIVLKVCSTFDSTAEGNIGPVLEALAARLGAGPVIVCPAFPENGRSVYQGHLFVTDKLLNESGMQDHPLTPMTDPDIRRVLAAQTNLTVGHVSIHAVSKGTDAIVAAMPADTALMVTDAIHDGDLLEIGNAARGMPLLCGGSGIALGLPGNFGVTASPTKSLGNRGAGVVLSGSCSKATRAQVASYRQLAPSREISAGELLEGGVNAEDVAAWVMEQEAAPMVFSSADPDVVKDAQRQFGASLAAEAIEGFFAELAAVLARRGIGRIVVAGGETSGAVVKGLGVNALEIGPRLAAGVPMVRPLNADLVLALKSGNFGGETFFEDALRLMLDTEMEKAG